MPLTLELVGVSYSYPAPTGAPSALDSVALRIGPGERICVLGPNGAGKSTLAQVCAGILSPDSGHVLLDGRPLSGQRGLRILRARAGLLFQCAEDQLFSENVFSEIAYGPARLGLKGEELTERVREACQMLGLDLDSLGGRSPFTLSEGEKRKVALASVLARRPELLVLDEPFIGLDAESRAAIRHSIDLYAVKQRAGVLITTHEPSWTVGIATKFILLSEGKVTGEIPREEFAFSAGPLCDYGFRLREWFKISSFLGENGSPPKDPFDPGEVARAFCRLKGCI